MSKYVEYFTCGLVVALILVLIGAYLRHRSASEQPDRGISATGVYVIYLFLWMAGTNILLYVTGISPKHAMEPKYLSMVWPFYAFIPVLILQSFCVRRATVHLILCVQLLLSGTTHVAIEKRIQDRMADPAALLEHAPSIVADKVSRGVFPRFFWHFPDETPVFAAVPKDLVAREEQWLDHLAPGSVYLSDRRRKRILQMLSARYDRRLFQGAIWGFEVACVIDRKHP
jgi:hypothetical protein